MHLSLKLASFRDVAYRTAYNSQQVKIIFASKLQNQIRYFYPCTNMIQVCKSKNGLKIAKSLQSLKLLYMQMKNPFELLDVTADEEDTQTSFILTEEKHKKIRPLRRIPRKLPEEPTMDEVRTQPVNINEPIPERIKQAHFYPYMERDKILYRKELTAGHYLDRQSGTGREDRPRKAGGGYGSVGNVKDEFNRQKYLREDEQENPEAVQKPSEVEVERPFMREKVAEPEKITLSEYYHSKGIDFESIAQFKAPVKKHTIDMDLFKKEKFNLLQTKEDLKNKQRMNGPVCCRYHEGKVGLSINGADPSKVGFGYKLPREQSPRLEQYRKDQPNRPRFSKEDFPTL